MSSSYSSHSRSATEYKKERRRLALTCVPSTDASALAIGERVDASASVSDSDTQLIESDTSGEMFIVRESAFSKDPAGLK